MKFRYGITLLLLLFLSFWNCARIKKETSHIAGELESEGSSLAYAGNDSAPRDSIIQSYFSDKYSIHIFARLNGSDFLPFPEYMRMVIYNRNGQTIFPADGRWFLDLEHGVVPLEPEWPDYFLVHEDNTGNCCTCGADYLMKVTADEIKFIGLVNGYNDGKFYVNICDWHTYKTHDEMTLTVHEAALIDDTLHYPENYNR
jgi:hypothetical protein